MFETCEKLLSWWELGCVSPESIKKWADEQIESIPDGSKLPNWLIDLSLKGPRDFLKTCEPDYPRPKEMSFSDKFRAMVEITDPNDKDALDRFAEWVASACMGEDLESEPVRIGYEIDHAFSYQNSGDPLELAREAIVSWRESSQDIAVVLGSNWRLTNA